MNKLFFLFFLLFGFHAYGCNNLLDTDLKILNEKEFKNLCEYSDHTILVVNTASKCGFTYEYEQLESLQRRFKDQKFTVLGFPSRNFMGQEFRDEEKVSEFCKATFLQTPIQGFSASFLSPSHTPPCHPPPDTTCSSNTPHTRE